MPLPSFFLPAERVRAWNVARAASYGAALGALAALFKAFGPARGTASAPAHILEVAAAALAFAVLCAGAAALRNYIARRLIWPEMR
jgi:hypothetical protein